MWDDGGGESLLGKHFPHFINKCESSYLFRVPSFIICLYIIKFNPDEDILVLNPLRSVRGLIFFCRILSSL